MSSIFKAGKLVGVLSSLTRSITPRLYNWDGTHTSQRTVSIQDNERRYFSLQQPQLSTVTASEDSHAATALQLQTLDRALYRLDQDIRRTGRIRKAEIEEIFSEIKTIGTASSNQSLLMIRCCGNLVPDESPEAKTKLALDIWTTLEKLGVQFDISHYNALLRVYIENEHKFSPTAFLADMEKKGIEPNRVTYQRLITRFCQDGDIEGASRILEFMKQKDIPINEAVFCSLIMGHARCGDMTSAKGILTVMQQAQLEPTADTYSTLMREMAEKGEMEEVRNAISEATLKEIGLSDRDYLDTAFALAKGGHAEHVDEILGHIKFQAGYNQDAMNTATRLISIGLEEPAYKIYETMPPPTTLEGQPMPSGVFFIRQLVRSDRPLELLDKFCSRIVQEERNPYAYQEALHCALSEGKHDTATALLEIFHNRGIPIRRHYFYPLLAKAGKDRNQKRMIDTIKLMEHYGQQINSEALVDYLFPYIPVFPVDTLLNVLDEAGVPHPTIQNGLVLYHLLHDRITDAATTAHRFNSRLMYHIVIEALILALQRVGKDYQTLGQDIVSILRKCHDFRRPNPVEDIGGRFVEELFIRQVNLRHVVEVLRAMLQFNVGMTPASVSRIMENGGDKLTDEVIRILEHLATEPVVGTEQGFTAFPVRSLNGLERELARGETPTATVVVPLILLHARNHNLERVEELLQLAAVNQIELSTRNKIVLMDAFGVNKICDRAMDFYNDIIKSEKLTAVKCLRLSRNLVECERLEDAFQVIRDYDPEGNEMSREIKNSAEINCWYLLSHFGEKNESAKMQEIFDLLIAKKLITPNNMVLSPFVKMKLMHGDLSGAVSEFEKFAVKYNCTPFRNQLSQKLVEMEDTVNLQKVMDINTKVHGEVNALYDLVFAFIDCGRVRQAKKIMETPGFRARNSRLDYICKKYLEEKNIKAIEDLITVTKDVFDVDRERLYFYLLKAYCAENNVGQAMNVWTSLQEEDIQPTPEFLIYLSRFLQARGEKVPFAVPEAPPTSSAEMASNLSSGGEGRVSGEGGDRSKIMQYLRRGDLEGALTEKKRLEAKGTSLSVSETSNLIEALLKNERLAESARIATSVLSKGNYPFPRTLKYLCTRLAIAGDAATMNLFEELIPKELHARLSLSNQCFHARIQAGQCDEALEQLETRIMQSEDPQTIFPPGGILSLLERDPTYLPRVKALAEKCYRELQFNVPMNMIFVHYVETRNWKEADEIWNQYLHDAPSILSRSLVNRIKQDSDPEMGHFVLDKLVAGQVSSGVVGFVVSALISVYNKLNDSNKAMEVLNRVIGSGRCGVDHLGREAMENLKEQVLAKGQIFPYELPQRKGRTEAKVEYGNSEERHW